VLPIGQDQTGALQRTDAMLGDAVRVRQCGEHRADYPQVGSDSLPSWKFTAHRGCEPVHAQAAQPSWVAGAALQHDGQRGTAPPS
jgi:hypothetical protein